MSLQHLSLQVSWYVAILVAFHLTFFPQILTSFDVSWSFWLHVRLRWCCLFFTWGWSSAVVSVLSSKTQQNLPLCYSLDEWTPIKVLTLEMSSLNSFIISQPGIKQGHQVQWRWCSFYWDPSQEQLLIPQKLLSWVVECCWRMTNSGQQCTDLPLKSWSRGKELHLSRAH